MSKTQLSADATQGAERMSKTQLSADPAIFIAYIAVSALLIHQQTVPSAPTLPQAVLDLQERVETLECGEMPRDPVTRGCIVTHNGSDYLLPPNPYAGYCSDVSNAIFDRERDGVNPFWCVNAFDGSWRPMDLEEETRRLYMGEPPHKESK